MYGSDDWRDSATVLTFGNRFADLKGLPPSSVPLGGDLSVYVSPEKAHQQMRSPLKAALEDPQQRVPQIRRPPVARSDTRYPDVRIESRTSHHPRGDAEYLNLVPGWEPAQPAETQPPAPSLSPDTEWWAKQLSGRS
jgi:hypothetical protein